MRGDVLIVDDNEDFLRVARNILVEEDFTVHTAATSHEAIAFLERCGADRDTPRPSFVVLDYRLEIPATALDVLARMARRPALRAMPVLVISQSRWPEDETAVRAAGAMAFREKPSSIRALRELLVHFWKEAVDGPHHPVDRG